MLQNKAALAGINVALYYLEPMLDRIKTYDVRLVLD